MRREISEFIKTVRNDLEYGVSATTGTSRGIFHGLYTPFLVYTGVSRFRRDFSESMELYTEDDDIRFAIDGTSDLLGTILGASISQGVFLVYAMTHGRLKEYIGALIVSNALDYAINRYRSVIQKIKERELPSPDAVIKEWEDQLQQEDPRTEK